VQNHNPKLSTVSFGFGFSALTFKLPCYYPKGVNDAWKNEKQAQDDIQKERHTQARLEQHGDGRQKDCQND
jgi:hypothetical protein